MKIAILKCRDCGKELNRTIPFPESDESRVMISSGLAAPKCPNGCRSTCKDLNLNTMLEIMEAPEGGSCG